MGRPATAALAAVLAATLAAGSAQAQSPAPRRISFAEAVAIASGQAPAAQIAAAKTRAAEARVWQARSAWLPSLTGTASEVDRTFNIRALGFSFPKIPGVPATPDLIGPVDAVDARLRATQTLFDFSSWKHAQAAGRALEASRGDRGVGAEGAAQAAALAYLKAARATAALAARESEAALAADLVTLASAQVQAGLTPGIDATRARTQLAASRGALLMARNQLDRAQIDLARALGLDPATRFDLADSLSATLGESPVPEDSNAAVAFARAHRPDLAAERARLERAKLDRAAIGAERLPRLDAEADYGLSGEHAPDAIATRQVSIAVTVPILDGFRREGRAAEQGAVVRESEIRAHDLDQQVAADVEAARLDLSSGREQQSVADERLELASKELDQAVERFQQGVAGNIEVVNAQSSLVTARDAGIDARFAVAVARVALARAAGVAQGLH